MRVLAVLVAVISFSSVVAVGEDSLGPRLLNKVEPVCTAAALEANISEFVRVDLRINKKGEPSRLEVVESPGYGLGAKALETISQWRFEVEPHHLKGEPKHVDSHVEMLFRCR